VSTVANKYTLSKKFNVRGLACLPEVLLLLHDCARLFAVHPTNALLDT
jgi:hypothetical protein